MRTQRTPEQRFTDSARKLVRVPKGELEREEQKWRKGQAKRAKPK